MKKREYCIVDKRILSSSIKKVLQVNELIQNGKVKISKHDAIKKVGVSRSTYYKYKDFVKPFFESEKDTVFSLNMSLYDKQGILADILNIIAKEGMNILTIVQNLAVDGIARSTISIQTTEDMLKKFEDMVEKISKIDGVKDLRVIGSR